MKKKIYFITLIAVGVLGSIFSFGNVAFALDTRCSPTCQAELLPKCISMSGPNAAIWRSVDGPTCSCQIGYEQDINGYCRPLSEVQAERALREIAERALAACYSSNGQYAEMKNGVCGCKDGYQQFIGSMCQTITLACHTWRVENDQYVLDCPYKSCDGTYVNGQCANPQKQAEADAQKKAEEDTQQCVESRGENAEYKNFQCGCRDGYQAYIGNKCQTATEACQSWYGPSSRSTTANATTCTCEQGYVLSGRQCAPLSQPVPVTIPPTAIALPSPVSTVMPKPIIATPIKKKPQPSTESEVKTLPISEITASTTNQEQITTSPMEAPEIARPVPPAPIVKQENVFQRVWRKFLSWF